MYRKVHILGVQVQNVQFGATGTHREGKDWRCARLCSGNERQWELICFSNAHAHAYFPSWFHWATIQVVQCSTSQRMPGHRHMKDPSPLSAICVVEAHSGGEVCVESGGVLHSPTQGTPMQLDVHGGRVVDAKAYKGRPGLVFNSKAHHAAAPWGASLEGVRRSPPPPLGTTRTTMCTRLQCLRLTVGGPISVPCPKQT